MAQGVARGIATCVVQGVRTQGVARGTARCVVQGVRGARVARGTAGCVTQGVRGARGGKRDGQVRGARGGKSIDWHVVPDQVCSMEAPAAEGGRIGGGGFKMFAWQGALQVRHMAVAVCARQQLHLQCACRRL